MSEPPISAWTSTLGRRQLLHASGLALGALAISSIAPPLSQAASIHTYRGNYPNNRETGWSESLQGVTHDANNWFFTQTTSLWKFPVTHDLNRSVSGPDPARGILKVGMPSALAARGYNHFGDFDYVEYAHSRSTIGRYLFIAVEGGPTPCIAVFRASNLGYIGMAPLPTQTNAPWCAIHPTSRLLHSSAFMGISALKRYVVDWAALAKGRVVLTQAASINLRGEGGGTLVLNQVQGGVFKPDGSRLYLINGYHKDADRNTTGIHVFNSLYRRIARSTNGFGDFNYEYHPGFPTYEEPEGITYWDLNNGRAPGIRGVLHAIMLDNDLDSDDLYFKHYA